MSTINLNPIPEIYSETYSDDGISFKDIIQMVRDKPEEINNIGAAWVVEAFFADGNYRLLRGGFSKAAKGHVCDWCGMGIVKSSKYMSASVRFDDEPGIFSYKVCIDCVEALHAEDVTGCEEIISFRHEMRDKMEAKL